MSDGNSCSFRRSIVFDVVLIAWLAVGLNRALFENSDEEDDDEDGFEGIEDMDDLDEDEEDA